MAGNKANTKYTRKTLLLLVVAAVAFLIFVSYRLNIPQHLPLRSFDDVTYTERIDIHSYDHYLVKTSGCMIPNVDPFDSTIRQYISPMKKVTCGHLPPLASVRHGVLTINKAVLREYNISSLRKLKCCYQAITRVTQTYQNYTKGAADNTYRIGKLCTGFRESVLMTDEHIKVTCRYQNSEIYRDVFSLVVRRPGTSTNHSNANSRIGGRLNVLLLGLDSVSRLSFHRHMNATMKFVKNTMNATELHGFNKVGDNTFPNLVSLLTGKSEDELKKLCWPSAGTMLDRCPWIWNKYSAAGYVTAFGEDAPWMGIFNYMKTGFVHPPTDYYLRPGMQASENQIGSNRDFNSNLCQGSRLSVQTVLSYSSEVSWTFQSKSYFQLMWLSSLTHDYYNSASRADAPVFDYLKQQFEAGYFNNTAVVFFGDHGMRWGDQLKTQIGKLEDRLPFLFIYLPKWFRRKYFQSNSNLQVNAHRLVTSYDIHKTLLQLLSPDEIQDSSVKGVKKLTRGISLLQEIPSKRTCEDAGIDKHWCTCQKTVDVSRRNPVVTKIANFFVSYLNKMLKPYKQCRQLVLSQILSILVSPATKETRNKSDYYVTIETNPSKAIFDATVRSTLAGENCSLSGPISRINQYGNQSHCIANYELEKYCYCSNIK